MQKRIYILILFMACLLLCSPFSVASQNIKVTYDEESKVLKIDNQWDAIQLELSEDMPMSMQNAIREIESSGDHYTIGYGKVFTYDNISMDEMQRYPTFYYKSLDSEKLDSIPIQIKSLNDLSGLQDTDLENKSNFQKFLPFVIAGILLLVMMVVKLLYSRKKKKKIEEEREASSRVMQVMEEEKSSCSVGLDHVYQDPDNYFALDMHIFFQDTAVEKVYMSREIIKRVNSYFKTYLDNPERTPETGCYLIGAWEKVAAMDGRYNVSIEDMVTPGDDMIPGEFSLNFGLKIGINLGSTIRNLCEKTHRDYVQTAWMHSHPGLGLFLSTHDLTVQQQLTYPDEPKRLLAIVIDTNTPDWQTVFFSAKNNGTMNNKEDLRQVISFDTLLEWSRHRTYSASSLERAIEYTFNITSTDSADLFAFTSKAVNQMDDLLDASSSDKVYGFHAEIQQLGGRKVRLVSELDTIDPNWNNCFIMKASEASFVSGSSHYAALLNTYDFGIVYGGERQSYLLYRNVRQEIVTMPVPFKEMKEWTRRKRV